MGHVLAAYTAADTTKMLKEATAAIFSFSLQLTEGKSSRETRRDTLIFSGETALHGTSRSRNRSGLEEMA